MSRLAKIQAVFVPFEWTGTEWVKRDDIPRFVETREVINYITKHPEHSDLLLEWHEHSERDLIDEYIAGVGTPLFRKQ